MTARLYDMSFPEGDAAGVVDVGDALKWAVAVMDRNDKSLMFMASILANFIKFSGLTEKQFVAAQRVIDRVHAQFERGVLEIQGGGLGEDDSSPHNVTHISTRRPHKGGDAA